jgi:hypothetical protein
MFPRALALYRRHFTPLLLTAALALVPANLLMAGAVRFGLVAMSSVQSAEAADPAKGDLRAKVLTQDSHEPPAPQPTQFLKSVLPLLYAAVIIVALLVAGLTLAHAALVPLVLDLAKGTPSGPSRAWAAVGARIGGLLRTWILALALVALGCVFCVLPGIVLAAGFAFAAPVTMIEGLAGRAALERSWALMKGRWPAVLAMFVLIVLFTAAGSAVSTLTSNTWGKMALSAFVRLVTYPLPLVALVLLYLSTSAESPLPGSSAPGSAGTSRP